MRLDMAEDVAAFGNDPGTGRRRCRRARSRKLRPLVEAVESRALLAPLVVASLGDSVTDEYQFYGAESAAALPPPGTSSTTATTLLGAGDEVGNLIGLLSSDLSTGTGAPESGTVSVPPELFLTGRSAASNFVEELADLRSSQLSYGAFSTASRNATRDQGYQEDWALSGTTAAGFNYSGTGTNFAQEYEGYPYEFQSKPIVSQPGLVTQVTPDIPISQINVVTILIGGNDYAQAAENYVTNKDTAPLVDTLPSGQVVLNDAIETSIASAISAIHTASPTTKIVLMTTPDITTTPLVSTILSAPIIKNFLAPNLESNINTDAAALDTYLNATYGNMSGIKVIDTQQLFANFSSHPVIDGVTVNMMGAGQDYTDAFAGDGFHPGTILQGILAQAVVSAINSFSPVITPAVTPISDAEIVNFAINSQPKVTLTSSAPTSSSGQSITLSAQVTPATGSTGVPTGTVTFEELTTYVPPPKLAFIQPFTIPGTILGTVPLSSSGLATLKIPPLAAGTMKIAAVYSGDPSFEAVLSSPLTQTSTSTPGDTTTQLSNAQTPALAGQTVTFTALVLPTGTGQPVPTGMVTFVDQTTNQTLGTASLSVSGSASLSTSSLGVGTHTIVAAYGGDSSLAKSTSAPFTETVSSVSLGSTATATTAQVTAKYTKIRNTLYVTLNVIITPVASTVAVPGGTVTFYYGNGKAAPISLSGGQAKLVLRYKQAQNRFADAYYQGSAGFLGSGSQPLFISRAKAFTAARRFARARPGQ
jgi:hypothetical protein